MPGYPPTFPGPAHVQRLFTYVSSWPPTFTLATSLLPPFGCIQPLPQLPCLDIWGSLRQHTPHLPLLPHQCGTGHMKEDSSITHNMLCTAFHSPPRCHYLTFRSSASSSIPAGRATLGSCFPVSLFCLSDLFTFSATHASQQASLPTATPPPSPTQPPIQGPWAVGKDRGEHPGRGPFTAGQ